ncbi:MAG: hypothetical protein WKG01_27705 [Kofleriaceae bacterium]
MVCVANALANEHGRSAPIERPIDAATLRVLDEASRYRECLRFRRGATTDSLEQVLALLAVIERRDVRAAAVPELIAAYLARLRRDYAALLAAIRAAGQIAEHQERVLLAVAADLGSTSRQG